MESSTLYFSVCAVRLLFHRLRESNWRLGDSPTSAWQIRYSAVI